MYDQSFTQGFQEPFNFSHGQHMSSYPNHQPVVSWNQAAAAPQVPPSLGHTPPTQPPNHPAAASFAANDHW